MIPTVVSALPEPENRLRGKGKKRAYILFLKMGSKDSGRRITVQSLYFAIVLC